MELISIDRFGYKILDKTHTIEVEIPGSKYNSGLYSEDMKLILPYNENLSVFYVKEHGYFHNHLFKSVCLTTNLHVSVIKHREIINYDGREGFFFFVENEIILNLKYEEVIDYCSYRLAV